MTAGEQDIWILSVFFNAAKPSHMKLLLKKHIPIVQKRAKQSIENCKWKKIENSTWTQTTPVLCLLLPGCGSGRPTLGGAVGCRLLSPGSVPMMYMVLLLPCWNPVTLLMRMWTARAPGGGNVSGLENWRYRHKNRANHLFETPKNDGLYGEIIQHEKSIFSSIEGKNL